MQPLLYAALAFGLGDFAAGLGPPWLRGSWPGWTAAALLTAGLALLGWPRPRWLGLGLGLAGCFCLGLGRTGAAMQPEPEPALPSLFTQLQPGVRDQVLVSGYLRDSPDIRESALRFDLEMESVQAARGGGPIYAAAGGLRMYRYAGTETDDAEGAAAASKPAPFPGELATLQAGDGVTVLVHARAVRSVHDPGVEDPAVGAAREGIAWEATLAPGNWRRAPELRRGGGAERRARLWRWISMRLDGLAPPAREPEVNAVLRGMLLGDVERLDEATRTAFQADGVYHLLVVAGLHIGILAAALLWVFRRLRLGRWLAEAATLIALGGYAWIIAGRTPTLRALLMLTIYFVARLWYRERSPLNAVGIAGLALLVAHPLDLYTPGWQMSLGAGLLLAGVAHPWLSRTIEPRLWACRDLAATERDEGMAPWLAQFRIEMRMLAERLAWFSPWLGWRAMPALARAGLRITELGAIALVLQIGFAGFNEVYFHRLNPFSVIANLALVPLAGVLIPTAWAGMMLPARLATAPVSWLGQLLVGTAVAMARWPGAQGWTPTAPNWYLLAFGLGVAAWIALAMRSPRGVMAGGAVAATLALGLGTIPFPPRLPPGLSATVLDVGQGDAIFVSFPDGRTMLVDGGPRSPHWDSGREIVAPFLWSLGLRRIDAIVLTHAHEDHLGGLGTVQAIFRPEEVWVTPTLPSTVGEAAALLTTTAGQGATVRRLAAGAEYRVGATVLVDVLLPPPGYHGGEVASNSDSMALRLRYGDGAMLLAGDMEREGEDWLLDQNLDLHSQLLKVGHHGSDTSSTPGFLAAVNPAVAVISVGRDNLYGHPSAAVVQRLAAGARVFRTDEDGAVQCRLAGSRLEVFRFPVLP